MKKTLALLLATLMTGAMALSAGAAFDRTYTAPYGTPDMDGEVDAVWEYAEWTAVDKPFDGSTDTDSTLQIKMLWDEYHLYFLAEVYDTDINVENDIVEVYIDELMDRASAYGDDDSQTRFKVADGKLPDNAGTNHQSDVECVVNALGGDKYLLEGCIMWMAAKPVEGLQIGLEFMYNEGNAASDFVEAYRWNVDTANGDTPPYQSTECFGTLTLGAAPVVETEAPETEAEVVDAATPAVAAAPQTFDAGVIAAVAAIVSAAGYAVSKKR